MSVAQQDEAVQSIDIGLSSVDKIKDGLRRNPLSLWRAGGKYGVEHCRISW